MNLALLCPHPNRKCYCKGRCRTCYNREHKNSIKANCHPDRPHEALGFCRRCYKNQWADTKRVPKFRRNPIYEFVVYLWFDPSSGQPVYVGRGSIDRAKCHKYKDRYNSAWWRPNLALKTMTCKDEWEAMEYEGKWGGYYRPIGNIEGNRVFRKRQERRSDVNKFEEEKRVERDKIDDTSIPA